MQLKFETKVLAPVAEVVEGFNETLFKALSPPFPPVKLRRFDGSRTGDIVSLELNFILFRQRWTSEITYHEATDSAFVFVDEGRELPFFLKFWKHRHSIVRDDDGHTCIVDDITYRAPYGWLSVLLYPVLFLQFWYRKPIYRRFFGKPQASSG